MATIYFTNNADSGDGSLRAAWSSASDGDVIMPDPSAFQGDVIEILLASSWAFKSMNLTLDGGTKRIILNGQSSYRVGTGSSADIENTFRNVDFKNFSYTGTGSTAVQYPIYISGLGSLTFTNCRFYGNQCASGASSAFIRTTNLSSASIVLNNCIAYNNGATETARFIQSNTGTFEVNGCTLISSVSGNNLTNNDSILSSDTDFANAEFVDASNNDYRLQSGSPYFTGGTLTGTDFLGHTRNGEKGAYAGSWLVVPANGRATIASNTTVDYAEIGNGATVTFIGSDRILASTKGATVGTATFSASTGSTGYFATPAGTDTSDATFTGVKAATYGAGVSNFTATTIDISSATLSWNQTTSGIPVALEKLTSGTWTTITTTASSPYSITDSPIGGKTFRIFDGTTFLTVTTQAPVTELSAQYQVISGTVASLTEDENKWETFIQIVGVEDMNEDVKRGQAVTVLARIYDAFNNNSPLLNDGTNIVSVHYTCEKRTKGIFQYDYTPIEGHENVDAGTDCVLDTLIDDDGWDEDSTGYNFILTPDITEYDLFEETGEYRFKVVITLSSGNPIVFYRTIQVTS